MASLEDQHAFLDAAKGHCWDEVRQMLDKQPELVNCQPAGRWSALHQAAWAGDIDAVSLLLQRGSKPELRTRDGQSCVDLAPAGPTRALLMGRRGHVEPTQTNEIGQKRRASEPKEAPKRMRKPVFAMDSFPDLPDVECVPSNSGLTRRRRSLGTQLSDEAEARRQMEQQVANSHMDDFWRLVKEGNEAGVLGEVRQRPGVLLERGPLGETPLHMLVLYRHFHLAHAVAERYPKLIVDQYSEPLYHGENVLHLAIVLHNMDFIRFLLEKASGCGLLTELLSAKADGLFFANGKPCYYGQHPLGFAVCMNMVEIVLDMVWKYEASLETVDSYGNNVLHLTVVHRLPEMYDALVRLWEEWAPGHAKDTSTRLVWRQNAEGLTPLSIAAKYGYCDIFDHILQATCETQWSFGPVTSILLPLDSIDYFPGVSEGALKHVIHEGHLDLLMLPLMQELINRKWEQAQGFFMQRFGFALGNAAALSLMVIFREPPTPKFPGDDVWLSLHLVFYCLCKLFVSIVATRKLYLELREMVTQGYERYFGCRGAIMFENVVSLAFGSIFTLSLLMELTGFATVANAALALSGLFSWVYLLWFLLGFSSTGHLVVMIWKILTVDFARFAMIISIFLMGFSLAFFVATTTPQERSLSLFSVYLFDAFQMITGGIDRDAHQGRGGLATSLLVSYSLMVTVLLLNLLIAMMNDTYNRISEMAEQQWQMERARIVISIEQEQLPEQLGKYWLEIDGQRHLQMEKVCDTWARS